VKIVVDTNIVFSGLLNSTSGIGKLLIASQDHFQFYTCSLLHVELADNRIKLKKLAKISDAELDDLIDLVKANIMTISENLSRLDIFGKQLTLFQILILMMLLS